MAKKQFMNWIRKVPVGLTVKGWECRTLSNRVELMAEVGIYAMVRNPGAMPFVVAKKTLFPIEKESK